MPFSSAATQPPPWRLLVLGALALFLGVAAAPADDWKYDVVVLKKDGKKLKGLLVNYSDKAPFVELRVIIRKPGERTRVETHLYDRGMVDSVEPLDDTERERLEARLKALDITGKELAERIRKLDLERVDWAGGKKNAFRYEGEYFILESNVNQDLFRLTAVRLAQVYVAYSRCLPPRHFSARPTTIYLARSLADYQALLKHRGLTLFNPAFYDPVRNQIVCGSDLEQLGAQLDRARADNDRLREQLKAREDELARLYKGKVPRELMRPILEGRQRLAQAEAANGTLFEHATRQLLQRLYHESFHAYLANFVYRPDQEDLPHWLNEGLAQIFETALFEAEELRIGHADRERLKRAQALLAMNDLVPLGELLRSTPKQFLVAHTSDRQTSDRYYLTSWALASYLAFDKQVLGTEALDRYARATFRGDDPVRAFCELIGEAAGRLPMVEKEFRSYVQYLRPNGTVVRPK